MQTNFLLEIMNGGAVTPELMWLVLLAIYLTKESRRRGLHAFDWLSLPSSMDFILAVFISDFGVYMRSLTIWIWRVSGAGDFTGIESGFLVFGGALVVLGPLCKIRAMTKPDHGDRPWLVCILASAGAIVALLFLR